MIYSVQMKTAIIVHGMPSKEEYLNPHREDSQSNSHWFPWIQQQLILHGVLAQVLEFPKPYEPVYEDWKSVFERFDVDTDTMLIGHSCGAGFLTRWLSENKVTVGKVALVAPWLDPGNELSTGFFDFEIDTEIPERTGGMNIFISRDDEPVIQASVEMLKNKWPEVKVSEFEGKGHFTLGDMGTREFPELKEFLVD